MVETIAGTTDPGGQPQKAREKALREVCTDFETLFIQHMLKSMREAGMQEGLAGSGHAGQMMHAMFDEQLAGKMAKGGGIGIADILFDRMKQRL